MPLNRSVISSMNELVYHAKMWFTVRDLSPHDASFQLNEIPMKPLRYANPRETFKSPTPGATTGGPAADDDAQ